MKSLILSLTLLFSIAVIAQEGGGDHPCAADRKKLCPTAEKGAIGKCMKEHMSELSPACSQKITERLGKMKAKSEAKSKAKAEAKVEAKAEAKAEKKAPKGNVKALAKDIVSKCKEDLKKLCKETKSSGGAKLKCLVTHKEEVSSECKAVLP